MKIFDILFGEVKKKHKRKQHKVKTFWSEELCEKANKLTVNPLIIENLKVGCVEAKGLKAYVEEIAKETK